MSNCESCPSKGTCNEQECSKMLPKYGKIKNIIGIISGKGGVGKSTVTGILAAELCKKGFKVGVLDADVTGPSMPRILGVSNERAKMLQVDENKNEPRLIPVETESGIKVMSLNLLIEGEDQPVIWRGPLITGVLNQMYSDTIWGELDYLLIDMPPGTGDVALTIMQNTPLNGMIVVSTPQDMVSMIVKKVIIMIEKMNINLLGLVENMSYIQCDKCGDKVRIFSKKSPEEHVKYLGAPLLAEMPIDLDMVESLEKGQMEYYIKNSEQYNEFIKNFMNRLNK
ncbi:Mrp/NBP35 family ATP-binding protein [Clostridium botulinum C]|uniref:Iron-sulfur cluster carrier protein n=2 Tax=Clostridium botulinum TaxID=1491 RepID=A0A9Q4XUT0_CLOBO|nr:Mrp/NBP35 family ATP-binding protein [Clostridium botulinum]MCD3195463.1 Mrp/NBP35 family ATP-binding protein [Clostridium botulinum C]MCD3200879.1 Mrp/NBP35 family ATP-binding protein [Clostridium botulinum C]MCD3206287.1 Mrp/NBP35 family ATP-binding protein [Clostridium botulinum C]MCD3208805.1 Mrp/NBP35 family ATP-binding protein [Clostridium botulinum C]MCD3226015.1 Mrp/NBP35 family ATP-binding protein [Clostridium botulinum C]